MTDNTLKTRLAALPAIARELAETKLRQSGDLATDAPLEDAFARFLTRDSYDDCLLDCQDSFDETIEGCETDECKAGAAVALRKCMKGC